jgi:hypothetical protein
MGQTDIPVIDAEASVTKGFRLAPQGAIRTRPFRRSYWPCAYRITQPFGTPIRLQ